MSVPVRLCHAFVKVIFFENILHKIFYIKILKLKKKYWFFYINIFLKNENYGTPKIVLTGCLF
jgi:hypothetical protein